MPPSLHPFVGHELIVFVLQTCCIFAVVLVEVVLHAVAVMVGVVLDAVAWMVVLYLFFVSPLAIDYLLCALTLMSAFHLLEELGVQSEVYWEVELC